MTGSVPTRLIVVDATAYGVEPSGAKRRAIELLRRLPALLPGDVFEVHWARDGGGPPEGLVADNMVHAVVSVSCRGGWLRWRARAADLRRRHRDAPFTHLLVDHGPLVRPDVVRNVVTLHDLRFRHGYGGLARRLYGRFLYGAMLSRAAAIVAVSPSIAAEATSAYGLAPARVRVAENGVPASIFRPSDDAIVSALARLGVPRYYALVVGRDEPRKGLRGTVAVWQAVRRAATNAGLQGGLGLVVVGAPRFRAEGVVSLGLVSDDDLAALLSRADVLLAPSLYEGYDLPVAEALSCGTPVVASDIAAHRGLVAAGARGILLVPPARVGLYGIERWSITAGLHRGDASAPPAPPPHSWDSAARVVAAALTGA